MSIIINAVAVTIKKGTEFAKSNVVIKIILEYVYKYFFNQSVIKVLISGYA